MVIEGAQNCRSRSNAGQETADLELLRVEARDLELVEVTIAGALHKLGGFSTEKCLGRATIRAIARPNLRFADERRSHRADDDDDGNECQADGQSSWNSFAGSLPFAHAAALV